MNQARTEALITTTQNSEIGSVSPDMFGAIAIDNFGYHYFEDHMDMLGLTNIRFPGGTVSESGFVVDGRIRMGVGDVSLEKLDGDRSNFAFDLTHPELISPLALEYDDSHHLLRDDVGTFSQALSFAVENSVTLGLIIPVQRYFKGADLSDPEVREIAETAARSDINVFLQRLSDGDYNEGIYPQSITFEIGNEAYDNPIEYALIAKVMIEEISQQLAGSDIDYEIAFQMGRGEEEFNNLLNSGYFDPFFDRSIEMVSGLDGLEFSPNTGQVGLDPQTAIDEIMSAILDQSLQHIDAVRHHLLRFDLDDMENSGAPFLERDSIVDFWMDEFESVGIDPDGIDYYISAWTTDSSNGTSTPYELSAAANILGIFAHFMDIGVDRAAIWGVTASFRYYEDMHTTVVSDRLSDFVSPSGAILQLMTQNVMASDFLGSEGGLEDGYRSYLFEDETSYTAFYSVDALNGEDFELTINLGLFRDLASVEIVNLDVEDGSAGGASRLTNSEFVVEDGAVTLHFDQDFEIGMVRLMKEQSAAYLAAENVENFVGGNANLSGELNTLSGTDGSDSLEGSKFTDIIFAGNGDDNLNGGEGRLDLLASLLTPDEFDMVGGGQW